MSEGISAKGQVKVARVRACATSTYDILRQWRANGTEGRGFTTEPPESAEVTKRREVRNFRESRVELGASITLALTFGSAGDNLSQLSGI
jgi:hypothetical protein